MKVHLWLLLEVPKQKDRSSPWTREIVDKGDGKRGGGKSQREREREREREMGWECHGGEEGGINRAT